MPAVLDTWTTVCRIRTHRFFPFGGWDHHCTHCTSQWRLSLSGWLVSYQGGLHVWRWSPRQGFNSRQCQQMLYVLGRSFIHTVVQTDTVTTISRECIQQSRWNFQGIFTSLPCTDDLIDFRGQKSRSQQAQGKAKASRSVLGRQRPCFSFCIWVHVWV